MDIRPAEPNEFEAISALAAEAFDTAVAPHYSQQGIDTFHKFNQVDALKERTNGAYETFVAIDHGETLGMAHVKNRSHIAMLFVKSDQQRSGIGRQLVAFIRERCPTDELTLNASPNAIPAYLRIGFERSGEDCDCDGIRYTPISCKFNSANTDLPCS